MAFLGVLMLDTRFARPLGDAGNPDSYHCPTRIRMVAGAGSLDIVQDGEISAALTQAFVEAARALEAEGAGAIVSTCGFLVTAQQRIAHAVNIPVCLSALSLFGLVQGLNGGRRLGILTASRSSLGAAALRAAGIDPALAVIAGMEDCAAFADAILTPTEKQNSRLDQTSIAADVVEKARGLMALDADIGAIILECGNLPPYADAIRAATGRPVYSILDAARFMLP